MRDFFFTVCAMLFVLFILAFICNCGYAVLGMWGVPFDKELFFKILGTLLFITSILGILLVLLNDENF